MLEADDSVRCSGVGALVPESDIGGKMFAEILGGSTADSMKLLDREDIASGMNLVGVV